MSTTKVDTHEHESDFRLYLADPELAKSLDCEPVSGIDPSPQECGAHTLEPGDLVTDEWFFYLVYEGMHDGRAMVHHVEDGAKAWRPLDTLALEKKHYVTP